MNSRDVSLVIANIVALLILLIVFATAGSKQLALLISAFLLFIGFSFFIRNRLLAPVESASKEADAKLIQSNLAESRKKERAMIDNAADVICVIDEHGRFLSVNPAAERNWGYPQAELLGKSITEFVELDSKDSSLQAVLGAKASIDKIAFENRLRQKNGNYIDLSWSAHWSASDDGLFCVVRDVTVRKLAEKRLVESEQRIRTTFEAMPVGIACTNLHGHIEYVNKSLENFCSRSSTELLGSSIAELFENPQQVHDFISKMSNSVTEPPMETKLHRKQSEPLNLELSASIFYTNQQKKILLVLSDITQRKEIERLRNQFVSMINHDLRAPLTSLNGSITILREGIHGPLNEKGVKLCNMAEAELDRLLLLIKDLLDFERIESGNLQIKKELVSVDDIVEASISSVKSSAQTRGIQLEFEETELPCKADRGRIIQVLVNLLSNAIKFSPDNSKVGIKVEKLDTGIKFLVIDHGRGVPPGKESVLFARFKQVAPDDAVESLGSGLGLSICKAIVDAHGGEIGCDNSQTQGSIFWFLLRD